MDGIATCIQPYPTDRQPEKEDTDINDRECNLLRAAEPLAIVEEEPEDAAKAVREPGGEEGGDETEQVVEDGNGFGDDPSDDPEDGDDGDPGADREPGPLGHVFRAAEEADVATSKVSLTLNELSIAE